MQKPEQHPHKPGSRAARREANAKAREAQRVADQAALIAKRASMSLDTIILVMFRGGAHAVRLHNIGQPIPEGFSEARVSLAARAERSKAIRGPVPGLRYVEAESLAASLAASLARNLDTSRRAVSPTLRRRA